ncbi:DUF305 domain-containing protein [Streptomyces pluripotens]|uniref:DUF305 domain-containing protein n=1 Tax=Streptomyces pluripotens TaxID=1355015 RepID=A0A221NWM2_9ACTN|nr:MULTISPECIES: DUF305 domain-containing protein [Streptomyces]ARP69942.1 DUF305 domain-containing protein [Streptomyces pluripotens]ASN24198.1 DUF305 domain-containing protein [Streptomyces pluripotens]MCH0555540.1 DUF305 domain-containing protein [Streptomyces sp. MUM 16J]
MRRRHTGWAVGAAAALLVTGGAIAYTAVEDSGGPSTRTPDTRSADAGFARDMAVHHQQAVEMSYIIRDRTENREVRGLAYDIAQTQANQRGMMLGWLDLWGVPKVSAEPPMSWMGMGDAATGKDGALMPGMATHTDLDKLRSLSGKQAEILYLQLMTAHHKGGVHMAEGCVATCEVEAEKRLAQGMVEAQRSEIELMAGMLKERGAQPIS